MPSTLSYLAHNLARRVAREVRRRRLKHLLWTRFEHHVHLHQWRQATAVANEIRRMNLL